MFEEVVILFGGCVVEEVFLGVMSIGVFNDFECVIKMVCDMVMCYGMSDVFGIMVYVDMEQDGFFGCMVFKMVFEVMQQKVDLEICCIVDE